MTDHQRDDVTDQLHLLAGRMQPPLDDPEADLRRGRVRLVRRRVAVGGAALLTLSVIGGAALAGSGLPVAAHDRGNTGYADTSGSVTPTNAAQAPTPATQATPAQTPAPASDAAVNPTPVVSSYATVDPTPTSAADGGGGFEAAATPTLQTYNTVLAEHLDPQRQHLQPFTERTRNEQSSTANGVVNGFGSKFGWQVPGSPGLGMLEVYVSRTWRGTDSFADPADGWQDATVAGATRAQVATDSGGAVQVRAERADGLTVLLIADPLFGNNSLVAVPDMGLTSEQLLQAAVDPRLVLPSAR